MRPNLLCSAFLFVLVFSSSFSACTTSVRGDGESGDGDGQASGGSGGGDGDGDVSPGDGDGDASPGDGDGDVAPGDGDGDVAPGDGDGDGGDGDGDGDGDVAPGDGDGDGDGDTSGPACGDGLLDDGETCDEGPGVESGGCASCQILPGWDCEAEPSECVSVDAPVIESFDASTLTVPGGGGQVQLTWSVGAAETLRIETDPTSTPIEVVGNSLNVDVTSDTTFVLIAENEGGQSERTLTVLVDSIGEVSAIVQFGSSAADAANDLAIESDGSFYVVGKTSGSMDGANEGGDDAFFSKFSSEGDHFWTRQIGSDFDDEAFSVATDNMGFVYVAGVTYGALENGLSNSNQVNCFISQFSSEGALRWLNQFSYASCAVATFGTAVYLGSSSPSGTYVRKFSSDGATTWIRSIDFSASNDSVTDCVADETGVYVVGSSLDEMGGGPVTAFGYSHDGDLLWSNEWSGTSYIYTGRAFVGDGALFVSASAYGGQNLFGASAGFTDPVVARRSLTDGMLLDGVQLGSAGYDAGLGVALDPHGHVLVVGRADGSFRQGQAGRHFVAKRTQDNEELWTRQFGPTDDAGLTQAVAVAPNGTVIVTGSTTVELSPSAPGGSSDAFFQIFR